MGYTLSRSSSLGSGTKWDSLTRSGSGEVGKWDSLTRPNEALLPKWDSLTRPNEALLRKLRLPGLCIGEMTGITRRGEGKQKARKGRPLLVLS